MDLDFLYLHYILQILNIYQIYETYERVCHTKLDFTIHYISENIQSRVKRIIKIVQ